MRGATPLAVLLLEHGMGEVAPALVAPALVEQPTVEDVSWAMGLALRAIVIEEEIGDLEAARRTFGAAKPILEIAEHEICRAACGRALPVCTTSWARSKRGPGSWLAHARTSRRRRVRSRASRRSARWRPSNASAET